MNLSTKKTSVLIVGSGPVGMTLALLLKASNVDFIIIDKRLSPTTMPRAIAINQATMDVFDSLGLKSLLKIGEQVDAIDLYFKARFLGQFSFKGMDIAAPYFYHISQDVVESHLESSLQDNDVTIFRGHVLNDYLQHEPGIMANLTSPGGESYTIQADYIVGADGGDSTVRSGMGEMPDIAAYGAHFQLCDVRFVGGRIFDCTRYIFTRAGYVMIVPIPNECYRVIFSYLSPNVSASHEMRDKAYFQAQLIERLGESAPEIEKIHWHAAAPFGHKITWRVSVGRAVIIGDAAHQFSPVGGTNMNVGINDAFALAWRLVWSLQTPALGRDALVHYAKERFLLMREQQLATAAATALMTRTKLYPQDWDGKDFLAMRQQLLGYPSFSKQCRHLNLCFPYSSLKEILPDIHAAFLAKRYVLLFNQVRASRPVDLPAVCESFAMEYEVDNACDYYLFRPDGMLLASGGKSDVNESLRQVSAPK